jgi:4'-phosphopantetheinyl transferase
LSTHAETQPPGEARATLPPGEVHVWQASLERPVQVVALMRDLLSADERERADRYRFERHRSRYTVGRALLRTLLARYTDTQADELAFDYGEFGKPSLSAGPSFNLSHSGAVALYAFATTGELGIDVELDDADFAKDKIAERFFSPAEVRVLRSLPPADQPRAFLRCWTRKEAFIKARGDGLSLALDSFDVTLTPDVPAALLRTAWSEHEPRDWQLEDLSDPAGGYVAALAIRAYETCLVRRYWVDKTQGAKPGQETE